MSNAMGKRMQEAANKTEKIKNTIIDFSPEFITATEISELTGISKWTVMEHIKRWIKPAYPHNIISNTRKGYRWVSTAATESNNNVAEVIVAPANSMISTKYDYRRTEEGYKDPTAAKAMVNVEKEETKTPKPGDIWESEDPKTLFLVLSIVGNSLVGFQIKDMNGYYNPKYHRIIKIDDEQKYFSIRIIDFRQASSYTKKKMRIGEDQVNRIKNEHFKALGLSPDPIIKTVEKVVEKRVEVPVEKIVEKRIEVPVEKTEPVVIDRDDPMVPKLKEKLMLAEQRAEIWEKAYTALVNSRGNI